MHRLNAGDLVHIPAAVPLLQFSALHPHRIPLPTSITTEEPTVGIVIRELSGGYQEIYCRGDKWAVPEKSLYRIQEGKK
jgi:hypothetical protein